MRRPRKSSRKSRRLRVIRLWTYPEALRAVPYLRGLLASLRDSYLDAQRSRLAVSRLEDHKADRLTLIALEDAKKDLDKSEAAFKDTHRELRKLDVFLLDPLNGLALIPFQRDDELGWMLMDLFAESGLTAWRWHKDPLESRRPLDEIANLPLEAPKVAEAGA